MPWVKNKILHFCLKYKIFFYKIVFYFTSKPPFFSRDKYPAKTGRPELEDDPDKCWHLPGCFGRSAVEAWLLGFHWTNPITRSQP